MSAASGALLTRNGDNQVREQVIAEARQQTRKLAGRGLSVRQIETRLVGRLNETERELLWLIASHEVDRQSGSAKILEETSSKAAGYCADMSLGEHRARARELRRME